MAAPQPSGDLRRPPAGGGGSASRGRALKLRRLGQMGLTEIAGRTRQEASKWWDRRGANRFRPDPARDAAECRTRFEAFRQIVAGRFFAGAVDERARALIGERLPEAVPAVVAGAQRTLDECFDMLGYSGLSFGHPVDWHLDPVSGTRAPLVHWSRLNLQDRVALGDCKVVWEVNRHQWLVELAQAYRLTGDERYAEAFSAHVVAWLRSNPVGSGINWTSSLELALRLIAWCWALVLFRGSSAVGPDLFARMRASIQDHAAHVERYLSHYFSPNTHLTGEALGLFYAGTVFPDMDRAEAWRERGERILVEEIRRQVTPDGVYFEQSTCYQRYTVEIALHFLILCARNGTPAPSVVGERLQAMLDFLLAVRSPRGGAPAIGDADGGWLLPLARRRPDDLRGVFGTAAALFGRPDYAWAAGGVVPELLWLLGPAGLVAFDAVRPAPPPSSPSRLFAEGGYAVMRDRWDALGHHLIFDVGPLGCPVSGGHGHADLLSVQCSAFGQPFVIDPGTGTYADETWRSFFRSTAAHSTVMVDGVSQAVPDGPFAWRRRPRARLRGWRSEEAFDFADAEHAAYAGPAAALVHRRRVIFVKPRYWIVVDDLEGSGEHGLEVRFQLAPLRVAVEPPWVHASGAGGRGLLLRAFAAVALETEVHEGETDPVRGWVSPDYGDRRPAPQVVFAARARLPVRVLTLLLPVPDSAAPPPVVSMLPGRPCPPGLHFGETGESVRIADDPGAPVQLGRRSA